MLSDIEIAQACEMLPITEVADRLGIENKDLEQYGRYKAKVDLSLLDEHAEHEGKLILVTAITPTPAGEGKTTTGPSALPTAAPHRQKRGDRHA